MIADTHASADQLASESVVTLPARQELLLITH